MRYYIERCPAHSLCGVSVSTFLASDVDAALGLFWLYCGWSDYDYTLSTDDRFIAYYSCNHIVML